METQEQEVKRAKRVGKSSRHGVRHFSRLRKKVLRHQTSERSSLGGCNRLRFEMSLFARLTFEPWIEK